MGTEVTVVSWSDPLCMPASTADWYNRSCNVPSPVSLYQASIRIRYSEWSDDLSFEVIEKRDCVPR